MLNPQLEVARSLIPQGPEPIRSDVVDIYPLPQVEEFNSKIITPEIPAAMDRAEQEVYLNTLLAEREFLATKLGKEVPVLPEGINVEGVHKLFVDLGLGKLGLRNISQQGSVLVSEHCVVPFPAYSVFGESANPRLREFGSILGVAVILVTSDDKLIVQHKGPANKIYGDVPGASFAGLVDAENVATQTADILSIVKAQLLKEGQEEIGLAPSTTDSFQLTSIQIDRLVLHHELTFSSRSSLTSQALVENALRNRHKDNAVSFKENIVVLDATPQIVERLLTEVHCPFAGTHAGPLLMLGYRLIQQAEPDRARNWLDRVKTEMDRNYARIDSLCDGGKYTPSKSSTEQGLPSFKDELGAKFRGEYEYVECAWKSR